MPPIQGLICIDLWGELSFPEDTAQVEDAYTHWITQLIDKLKEFKFDSIVDAGYNKRIDFADKGVYNTILAYNWTQVDEQILLELVKNCSPENSMNIKINQQIFGKNTFALYSVESFIKHVTYLVPHVKNWLVVGQGWRVCTHARPLGLIELSKVSGHNFYGATWGFFQPKKRIHISDDEFKHDNAINWTRISDDMYKVSNNQVITLSND